MVTTNISTGFMEFRFTDEDGDVFASFKLNPTDPRLHARVKNVAAFFDDLAKTKAPATAQGFLDVENAVEDKFCEFVGYDCRKTMFSRVAATDVMADGRMFLAHVMDVLLANVAPEIRRRREEHIRKYTQKYTDAVKK